MQRTLAQSPAPPRGPCVPAPGVRPGLAAALLIGLLALLAAAPVFGRDVPGTPDAPENEYRVKAAALYHFIRYTTWPETCFEDERSPIVVLVVGENPFGGHLEDALADKVIGKRPILLRQVEAVPRLLDAHLVFEGGLEESEQARLLARCSGRPFLLFGDREDYARAGACGNFFIEDGKIRFEINTDAVKAAHLEISSQVLKLARIYPEKDGPK